MKKFNNVLITNDDGYSSEYLKVIYEKMKKYANNVIVIAPLVTQSAKSSSVSITNSVTVTEMEENIFALSGTPVDCVSYAVNHLNIDFDLVVSGCNIGENIGRDIVYSGTCGAALEATFNKIPAVAFSTARGNLQIVKDEFDSVFETILENDLISKDYTLNVNFPTSERSKGIKVAKVSDKMDDITYEGKNDELFAKRIYGKEHPSINDTDWWCYTNGYISLTPLIPTYFDEKSFNLLSKKFAKSK